MASQEDESSPFEICKDEHERDTNTMPVGFEFPPSDEVIITKYLRPKVLGDDIPCKGINIVNVNLYDHSPVELTETYANNEQKGSWYFFTPRKRKYEKGSRPDRAASGGYWKATDADKFIKVKEGNQEIVIGKKQRLEFWETANRKIDPGTKTQWLMAEYKVEESKQPIKNGDMLLDDCVLCKIYRSSHRSKRSASDAVNPNNPPPQQIQPPNKRARNEHKPKPKPNFEPNQIQPEPRNPTHNLPSQPAPSNPDQISDPSDDIFGSLEDIIPDLPPFPDQLEQDGTGPDIILPPQNFEQCSIQYDSMDNQQQNNYARIQFTAQNFVNESFQPQYSDAQHFELGSSSTMNQMNIMRSSRCSLLKPTAGSSGVNAVINEFLALL